MSWHPSQFEIKQDRQHRFFWILHLVGGELAESRHCIRTLIDAVPGLQINDTTEGRWHRKP